MAERHIVFRSKGIFRKILRLGFSAGKQELYISPTEGNCQVKVFRGSDLLEVPTEGGSTHDTDFTQFEHGAFESFKGKFHVAYKSTGESVAVVGPMKSEFSIPGLDKLTNPIEIGSFYPADITLFPSTSKIRTKDLLLPDKGQLPSSPLNPNKFIGSDIEDIFHGNPFHIKFFAIPASYYGQSLPLRFSGDDVPISLLSFIKVERFVLGIIMCQFKVDLKRGWLDHSKLLNSRILDTQTSSDRRQLRGDLRIIEIYFG